MIEKLELKDFYETYDNLLKNHEAKNMYVVHQHTQVDYGKQNDCNIEWCEKNGVPVFRFQREGGCVVNSKGNITLICMSNVNNHLTHSFAVAKSFIEFLKRKGVDAKFEKNDIMIGEYKVGSCVNRPVERVWRISGIQISINQDMEVIKNACRKKMHKIPKGLSDFGITTEDVEKWISEYFNKD